MYTATVELNNRKYEVKLQKHGDGLIKGDITGTRKIHVIWTPMHKLPWVSLRGKKQLAARILAKEILLKMTNDLISDNRCPGDGTPITEYESQLIKAGHVRRPCWVVVRGNKYLRAGCIVNAANLTVEERSQAKGLVDTWNTMCQAVGRPISFEELKRVQG